MDNILSHRLYNHRLTNTDFTQPEEVISWLGAVQSQDYSAAKWGVAQRAKGLTDIMLDQAFDEGKILRTHVLRPTWHFVTPADIRWMLALTAPRVLAACASAYRQFELDEATFVHCHRVLEKVLADAPLTRAEIATALQVAGINTDDLRLTHLVMNAELHGLICSGGRQGKQFTYTLMDARAPQKHFDRNEALAELARRYFQSHGPATLQDFVWWSGLTVADGKEAIEMVKDDFVPETVGDQTYWFSPSSMPADANSPTAFLLPNYDEYIVAYTDRTLLLNIPHEQFLDARGNVLFHHTLVIDGQVVGIWKRTLKKKEVVVELTPFRPLFDKENQAVKDALRQLGIFLGLDVVAK